MLRFLWDCAGFKRPLWLQECCKIFPGGTYKWNKLLWRVVLLMEEYKTLKDPCFFALSNKNYLNACGCTAGWEFWIKARSDAWTSLWRTTECNQRQQECIFLKRKTDHCWDNVTSRSWEWTSNDCRDARDHRDTALWPMWARPTSMQT